MTPVTIYAATTAAERRRAAARVLRQVQIVANSGRPNLVALLAMIEETQDRLRSMLATGTEFDQAFARRMIQALDSEIARLRMRMGPEFARHLLAVMQQADQNTVTEAMSQVGPLATTTGVDHVLIQFASVNGADLVQQVTEDMRGRIARAVNQGAMGTSTAADVAREIGNVAREADRPVGIFGRMSSQIERIHRTETQRLYEGASDARRQRLQVETGLTVTKTWVHVLRDRPSARPDHEFLHMVEIPQNEHFNVGAGQKWSKVSWETAKREGGTLGIKARGPQDSVLPARQVVNCGCTVAPGFSRG